MLKIKNENGKYSRTVIIAGLQIASALILAVAEFMKNGDFSTYAFLLLANGVVMLVLRHLTDSALV